MAEALAPGARRRVHRISDEESRGRGPVPREAYEALLSEYRKLVDEFMTCCMSSERYLLARAVIERGNDTLAVD